MFSSPNKLQPTTPLPAALSSSPVSLDLASSLTDKTKIALAMEQMRQFIAQNGVSPASSTSSSRSTQPQQQEQPDFQSSASSTSVVQFAPSSNPFQTQPTQTSASPRILTPSFSRHPSFNNNAPPPSSSRNPSPPKVVRSRPSLEEVLASRPSTLKRRLSTDSLLSEEEDSLGVLIGEGGGMEVDEEEDESIERTPSPYLGDAHHHHQSVAATVVVEEPSSQEEGENVEGDMKTGGLLDNLLGGDAQVKGDEQRRWKEHKEGKTPPLGGGGFSQHNHPIPLSSNTSQGSGPFVYPLPQGLGRAASLTANEDSPVEHQSFGLGLPQNPNSYYQAQFGNQQERSGGFSRAVSFNEPASSSSHQAQTSYLHASSSMPMANRTLSDPFITNLPRANASSIHSSPTAAVASPYHAPPGLIKAAFAGQLAQSPRQDKDCYWSSSPSGPVVGSQRSSSAGSIVSGDGGISRPASRSSERSSGGEEDEYATPGRQAVDLPFVSDEGSSNSSHHGEEGSVFDSGGGAHLYAPHSAIAGGSRMGSLLHAGQLASEHAGYSSPAKVEDESESNKDSYLPILKRRGEMGLSDAGESDESELEAEEDEFEQDELEEEVEEEQKRQSRKGKEREATPEESTTGKKKGKGKGGKGKKAAKSSGETASPEVQREADLPPQGLPEGPRPTTKPCFSYAGLIGQAILAHPEKRLSLNAIYDWIVAAYPFYSKTDQGWMNSIRHNLSLNVCFIKKERAPDGPAGKGNLWMIEEGAEPQFANGGYKKNRPGAVGKGKKGAVAPPVVQPEPAVESVMAPPTKKRARKSKKSAAFDSDDEKETHAPKVEQHDDEPVDAAPSPSFSSSVFLEKKVAPLAAPPPKRQKKKKAVETPAFASSSSWATASSSSDAFGPGHPGVLSSSRQSGLVYAPPPPPSAYRPQYNHAPGYYNDDEDSAEAAARASEGEDDFATPQRPRSRGPPSGTNDAPTSEGQVVANPIATRGLPHLTPSVSSPVSSPGPPTMPRQTTQGARAHQKYIKSSLHDPENVRIREEEEPEEEDNDEQDFTMEMSIGDETHDKEYPIASGSLQPAFHMQPQSSSRAPATGPPGSPRFAAGLSAGISLSPMSSVRGTAHGGDEEDTYRPYNFPSTFGHQSPLQSRTRDPSGHKRMLSQTGSLIAHALKTPGMQPIHSSPGGRGAHPFDASAVPHSPLGSANRRTISYGASSVTPKAAAGMYSYPSAFGGGTPARTPFHPSMNQSPAGAALLQSYGDALDPYNPSHGVEEALGQLSSSESPSGTPRNGGSHWGLAMYSPGFGDSPASARKVSNQI